MKASLGFPEESAPALRPAREPLPDLLRGVAVLGILWVNIVYFALPHGAYALPRLWGSDDLANTLAWLLSELFVEGAMRGLLSLLFGASIVWLLAGERRMRAAAFIRRNAALCALGLVHAHLLLNPYDVLFFYGVLGLLVWPAAFLPLRLVGAILAVALMASLILDYGLATSEPGLSGAARAAEQKRFVEAALDHLNEDFELRGGESLAAIRDAAGETASVSQFKRFWPDQALDVGTMMLIGIVLARTGWLTGTRPAREIALAALVFYIAGLTVNGIEAASALAPDPDPRVLFDWTAITYDLGRIPLTLGHVAIIALWARSGRLPVLRQGISRVGQVALSSYLLQSAVCVVLFYGPFIGLFGELERWQLIPVCIAIWLFLAFAARWWLARFRRGPLEGLLHAFVYLSAPARDR